MAYISQDDKKLLAPAIKTVLKKYGVKGTIAIRNHSTLVVTLKEGVLDLIGDANKYRESLNTDFFDKYVGYYDVNVYHIDKQFVDPIIGSFFKELMAAMKGNLWFDKSDSMSDYFHTAYYLDINVGRWDLPYVLRSE